MPKNDIYYSNTIIYKIYCKDENVKSIYVGHTINFIQRKNNHKNACKYNNLKIYKEIRDNGGWDNWIMMEIACYNCKNKREAIIKEREHYEQLNANLNMVKPGSSSSNFICDECNYKTKRKSSYDKHLLTTKHKMVISENIINSENNNNTIDIFICNTCNIKYNSRSGLWKHKKNCNPENKYIEKDVDTNEKSSKEFNSTDKDIIMLLLKDNAEFKHLILEQNKQVLELNKEVLELNKKIIEILAKEVIIDKNF